MAATMTVKTADVIVIALRVARRLLLNARNDLSGAGEHMQTVRLPGRRVPRRCGEATRDMEAILTGTTTAWAANNQIA